MVRPQDVGCSSSCKGWHELCPRNQRKTTADCGWVVATTYVVQENDKGVSERRVSCLEVDGLCHFGSSRPSFNLGFDSHPPTTKVGDAKQVVRPQDFGCSSSCKGWHELCPRHQRKTTADCGWVVDTTSQPHLAGNALLHIGGCHKSLLVYLTPEVL